MAQRWLPYKSLLAADCCAAGCCSVVCDRGGQLRPGRSEPVQPAAA